MMRTLALAALLALSGCGDDSVSRVEVARVAAPDGKTDAVVIEVNGGATADFAYDIFVLPHGAAVDGEAALRLYGATRNAHAYGVNLRWASPAQLRVEYLEARRILQEPRTVTVAGTPVQVEAVAVEMLLMATVPLPKLRAKETGSLIWRHFAKNIRTHSLARNLTATCLKKATFRGLSRKKKCRLAGNSKIS